MSPKREKKVRREKLANYAAALGRGSLAAQALEEYDIQKAAAGRKVEIVMGNNGFALIVQYQGGKAPFRQSYGA